jgi:hypothetical protein
MDGEKSEAGPTRCHPFHYSFLSYPSHLYLTQKLLAARLRATALLHGAWPGEVRRSLAAMARLDEGAHRRRAPFSPRPGARQGRLQHNFCRPQRPGRGRARAGGMFGQQRRLPPLPMARGAPRHGRSPPTRLCRPPQPG